MTLAENDAPWVDFTVYLQTGEPMACSSRLPNAVDHAKRFMHDGYFRRDSEDTVTLYGVERVEIHASSQQMREAREGVK